jgi:hypothetical protein
MKMETETVETNGNKSEVTINSENHHISIFLSIIKIIEADDYENIHIVIFDSTGKEIYSGIFEDHFGETYPKMRINIDINMQCTPPFAMEIENLNEEINYSFELTWTSILA